MIDDAALIKHAWSAREHAAPSGSVKVGCAIATADDEVTLGWNVGGPWGKGIHAEVCAITQGCGHAKSRVLS